jgi:outer membrane protein assembly factor BamC
LRDKFRTRIERRPDGKTEIYISHRGAVEEVVSTGSQGDSTRWTSRPSDPGLEAEVLSRLMVRLGTNADKAKAAVASAQTQPTRSRLSKGDNGAFVEDDEEFDRAWRRVGLALDRVGFTVEDRDRAQGVYFVRYVNQDDDANSKNSEGFLSKLFSSSDDKSKQAKRYRISVKGIGSTSQVSVLDSDGHPEVSSTAGKILALLNDQLK